MLRRVKEFALLVIESPVAVAAPSDGAVITGLVNVLLVRVCVPPTVTAEAELVPAVVTRRSPVPIVKIPLVCVSTRFPVSTLLTAPAARRMTKKTVANTYLLLE